jgi:hypothetical protein
MEMPQLRKSGIAGLRHLFLDGFPQAVWKRPAAFPHSHRPDGLTNTEIGELRKCGTLPKTDSSLTEAIHFGNDVHRPASHRLHTWMLCVGTLDAFRSESLVGFVGIRNSGSPIAAIEYQRVRPYSCHVLPRASEFSNATILGAESRNKARR